MKKILLILLTLGTVSCNVKQATPYAPEVFANKDTIDLMKPYPELAERIDKTESTPLDNYFKLTIATDSTCKIEWGNKKINRETNADYHFSSNPPVKYILFRGGDDFFFAVKS